MENKRLLKIAYAIAKFQDFVTEDFQLDEIEELDLDFTPTKEEIEEVLEAYDGWGMDSIEDKIRQNYLEN